MTHHEGYVNFEDGEVYSELEVDFQPFLLEHPMSFIFSIEDRDPQTFLLEYEYGEQCE